MLWWSVSVDGVSPAPRPPRPVNFFKRELPTTSPDGAVRSVKVSHGPQGRIGLRCSAYASDDSSAIAKSISYYEQATGYPIVEVHASLAIIEGDLMGEPGPE